MDILYIITFAIVWSTSSPGMKVADGQLDARHLPGFFLESRGRSYVSFALLVLSACVLALLVWGFMHMKWYMVILSVVLSIIVSAITAPFTNSVLMLYGGWIAVAGLTLYLWFS